MSARQRMRTAVTILRLLPHYLRFARLRTSVPLDQLVEDAASFGQTARPRREEEARIVACILRLHRLVGGRDDDCLPRSLLLYRELSRLGADPVLSVGFREDGGQIAGHAWVELRGHVVGEKSPERAFTRTVTFQPTRGRQRRT